MFVQQLDTVVSVGTTLDAEMRVSPFLRQNCKWVVIEVTYGIDSHGIDWAESEKWEKRKCIKGKS